MGSQNRQKKLKQRVEKLEADVKLLEEKIGKLEEDKANKAKAILEFATLIIGLVMAILEVVQKLL